MPYLFAIAFYGSNVHEVHDVHVFPQVEKMEDFDVQQMYSLWSEVKNRNEDTILFSFNDNHIETGCSYIGIFDAKESVSLKIMYENVEKPVNLLASFRKFTNFEKFMDKIYAGEVVDIVDSDSDSDSDSEDEEEDENDYEDEEGIEIKYEDGNASFVPAGREWTK